MHRLAVPSDHGAHEDTQGTIDMKFDLRPVPHAFRPTSHAAYRGVVAADWQTARDMVGQPACPAMIGVELAEQDRLVALRIGGTRGKYDLSFLKRAFGPLPNTFAISTATGGDDRDRVEHRFFRVPDCVHDTSSVRSGVFGFDTIQAFIRSSVIINAQSSRVEDAADIAELPTWACWILVGQAPPGTNRYRGIPGRSSAERGRTEMEPLSARNIARRRRERSRAAPPDLDRMAEIGRRLAWSVLTQCEPELDRATWMIGWILGHLREQGLTLADLDSPNLPDAIDAMVVFADAATDRHPKHVDAKTGWWPGRVYHVACDEVDRCFNPRRRRDDQCLV